MSKVGGYFKTASSLLSEIQGEKPHSSITDWVEVLSSDRYDELSLDGIPELVESVNLQGHSGTTEAARAIRKKLKYGNVHRQLRALVILRALTENAGHGFQLNFCNDQLLQRLKDMASDSLTDPKVKKRLLMVFHAWSIQYKDEPRMTQVAGLYRHYGGGGPAAKKPTHVPITAPAVPPAPSIPSAATRAAYNDDIYNHDWAPTKRGPDTYADLAAAKHDAEERKRAREAQLALEQREAEIERRERELKRKQDMAALEATRQREAREEAERRRKAKEDLKKRGSQPVRPKFDFQKEKPQVLVSVATAIQAASNLVNACRHVNREVESVTESVRVQENLDKAKAARRTVIRYIQLVTDEEYVGTLLEANEKIVEAIQLYDKLSKPAVLDSDSESDSASAAGVPAASKAADVEAVRRRLDAQRLEADRTGELQRLQERQKKESAKQQQRRATRAAPPRPTQAASTHPDLQDLDFGSISSGKQASRLPPPIRPDSDADSYGGGSLSDFSDYDSSDEEWRQSHSRRQSFHSKPQSRRQSVQQSSSGPSHDSYKALDDDQYGRRGLLDPNDPFGDPFADDETPAAEKPRMEWAAI